MSIGTIVVFLLLCVIVFFALRSIIRKKGSCSCGGSCESCHCCDASSPKKKGGLT
ncbi:MAG: FeoB-associated Cys-rich membrane protein [Clostridiales bacterium]|nr:FeoB-associated Cys-rich membrane protein [Clostridiales bacterium]